MELQVIELSVDDLDEGVEMIAFVDNPAIQVGWMAFNDETRQQKNYFAMHDKEKRIVAGPFMIPDMNIFRKDKSTGNEFFVKFSASTIEQTVDKYMKKGLIKAFNFMHDEKQPIDGVYIQQSFIINKEMGVTAPNGFEDMPDGTWFGFVKVENDKIWNDFVKTGKLTGFSVEGNFGEKKQNNFIMDIQKQFDDLKKWVKEKFNDAADATNTDMQNADTQVQMSEAQLADGTKIMIGGELKEGTPVTTADGQPVPDGEVTLQDGTVIAISGGMIAAVKTPDAPDQQMSAEVKAEFDAMKAENARLKEELAKYTSNEAFNKFVSNQNELNGKFLELMEEIQKSATQEKKPIEKFSNDNFKLDGQRKAIADSINANKRK